MGKKFFFTFNPAPPYFTFPFHLRECARSLPWGTVPSQAQAVEILRGFYLGLKNFLGIPDDFKAVLFSSAYEFRSFLGDAWFSHKSFHILHGSSGEEFVEMLKGRRYHPSRHPVKMDEPAAVPDGSAVFIVANEADSGSCLGVNFLKKSRQSNLHGFIHVDLSSCVPGIEIPFSELQSVSFGFNTTFGLPFSEVIWLVSKKIFNEFMLKYEGRFPADKLCTLAEPCSFYNAPDYLFLDVARKILDDFSIRGMKNIVNETIYKAALVKKAVSENPALVFAVKDEKIRSLTTIILNYTGSSANVAEDLLKSGMVVDKLESPGEEQKIRITNFPVHSKEQFGALADFLAGIKK